MTTHSSCAVSHTEIKLRMIPFNHPHCICAELRMNQSWELSAINISNDIFTAVINRQI